MKQRIKKPSNIMRKTEIEISEFEHQSMLVSWANLSVGKYPELKWLYAIHNGLKLNIGAAMKAKRSGSKNGVFDMALPCARKGYHGLYVEMKKIKGVVSDDQKEFKEFAEKEGYLAVVCYGFDDAKKVLEDYLS